MTFNFKAIAALTMICAVAIVGVIMIDDSDDSSAATENYSLPDMQFEQGSSGSIEIIGASSARLSSLSCSNGSQTFDIFPTLSSLIDKNNVTSVPVSIPSSMPTGVYTIAGKCQAGLQLTIAFSGKLTVTASEPAINISVPPSIDAVSGGRLSYSMSSNISGTSFVKESGNASWLSVSGTAVSGTAPSVSSKTTYTATIKAISPGGQTATQQITIDVYPVFQISMPDVYYTVGKDAHLTQPTANLAYHFESIEKDGLMFIGSSVALTSNLTVATNDSFTVKAISDVGPVQTALLSVHVVVTPVLTVSDGGINGTYAIAGSAYSFNVANSVSSAKVTLQGQPSWITVSGNKITVSPPGSITEASDVTFKIISTVAATSNVEGQSVTKTVTVHVEPVLVWTSVPTAAMFYYEVSLDQAASYKVAASAGEIYDSAKTAFAGKTLQFVFAGSSAQRVLWDFGDGTTSEVWCPVHTYAKDGVYEVKVTAFNPNGEDVCSSIVTISGPIVAVQDWWSENSTFVYLALGVFAFIVICAMIAKPKNKVRRH